MPTIKKMRIPVFVSAPSDANLSPEQKSVVKVINSIVSKNRLEWRALGRSDFPTELPLREVVRMIYHCSGGIILGFEQFVARSGTAKRNSSEQKDLSPGETRLFPTPWNQLEAGILFAMRRPLLIFRDKELRGGIFDVGTSEVYIHEMPSGALSKSSLEDLEIVFQMFAAKVRKHYYEDFY